MWSPWLRDGFLVMPVLKPLAQLQPNGLASVHRGRGRRVDHRQRKERRDPSCCHAYTQVSPVRWNCTTRRTYRNLRFAKDITVGNFGSVLTYTFTSWTTASATQPPHLPLTTNQRARVGPTWMTNEPQNPHRTSRRHRSIMKTKTWIAATFFGACFGVALVVACSDDSPGDADAAVCDCPAAEAPLAGRIVSVRAQGNITANGGGAASAQCAVGGTILGGSCEQMSLDAQVVLLAARIDRTTPTAPVFVCEWWNSGSTAGLAFAEAICLMPAP